jgi:CheY-like chemotaxis protein
MTSTFPTQILIVDDDEINSFIAAKLIKRVSPHTVVSACLNGQEALKLLKKSAKIHHPLPDFIFLDLFMPVMNGWEFLDAFQQSDFKKRINIIVLSSSVFRHDIDRAQKYPVLTQFISKPLTLQHLQKLFFETEYPGAGTV